MMTIVIPARHGSLQKPRTQPYKPIPSDQSSNLEKFT